MDTMDTMDAMQQITGSTNESKVKMEMDDVENKEEEGDSAVVASAQPESNAAPVPGLQYTMEQGGYKYYVDPTTQRQYCQDAVGYWYVYNEVSGGFVLCAGQATVGVSVNEETIAATNRRFEADPSGQFKLPRNDDGEVYFPLDEGGNPIFPYDVLQKRWTFPVDDTDEPIFPRNALNKPVVPVDENGEAIFPKDPEGSYIFPLDENHCPIPAQTVDGRVVVPKDESGASIIPRDREGNALIELSDEGIPLSRQEAATARMWKKFYKQEQEAYAQYQQRYTNAINQRASNNSAAAVNFGAVHGAWGHHTLTPTTTTTTTTTHVQSMFHPLSIEQRKAALGHPLAVLEKSKRVRPEDIDLPNVAMLLGDQRQQPPTASPVQLESGQQTPDVSSGTPQSNAATAAEDKATATKDAKRKALLSAQLNFSKKLANAPGGTPSAAKREQERRVSQDDKRREDDDHSRSNNPRHQPHPQSIHEPSSPKRRRMSSASSSSSSKSNRSSSPPPPTHAQRGGVLMRRARGSSPSMAQKLESAKKLIEEQLRGAQSSSTPPATYGPAIPIELEKAEKAQVVEHVKNGNNHRTSARRRRAAPVDDGSEIIFDIDELAQSDDIFLVRRVIRQEQSKYEATKAKIVELEKERELYKSNLIVLYGAEKRIEETGGEMDCDEQEYLSSSGSDRN